MFDFQNRISERTLRCDQQLMEQVMDMDRVVNVNRQLGSLLDSLKANTISRDDYDREKQQLKRQLPAFCFHAHFPQGRRCNDDAQESGLAIYDADHVGDPRRYWQQRQPRLEAAGADSLVALVHVTPSGEGLRIVFVRPLGMSIAQAQAWMARTLGDTTYDGAVGDLARCSYAVPRGYLLVYRPEVLFADHPAAEAPFFGTAPADPAPAQKPASASAHVADLFAAKPSRQKSTRACTPTKTTTDSPSFRGIPYADIVDEWMRQNGGLPAQGERHTVLYKLACDLVTITDADRQLMHAIVPDCGLPPEEMRNIVDSACAKPIRTQSRRLRKVLARLGEAGTTAAAKQRMKDTAWLYAPTPPPMPTHLPQLVRHLVSLTPAAYRPAVAHAVFPALAAHLGDTKFRYLDNVLHEATLMNVLVADTGAGKSCITKPIDYILADIRTRDAISREKEEAWNQAQRLRRPIDKAQPMPDNIPIQIVDADITNAAFVKRLSKAQGRRIYVRVNEIEQLAALAGRDGKQHFQIICLAFDPDGEYGQTRAGYESVTATVKMRFNFNASTTVGKATDFFSHVLLDGPLNRLNFCTLPPPEIGADIPVYGDYDEQYARMLAPYVNNLVEARGVVECDKARVLARRMLGEMKTAAVLTQDRVLESFSHRAVVIAWLKAMVVYVANGCHWERSIGTFAMWSLRYDMWCKLHFFGGTVRREMDKGQPEGLVAVCPNQLELLPEEFSADDVAQLRLAHRQSVKGVSAMLRQWVHRRKVAKVGEGRYRKL